MVRWWERINREAVLDAAAAVNANGGCLVLQGDDWAGRWQAASLAAEYLNANHRRVVRIGPAERSWTERRVLARLWDVLQGPVNGFRLGADAQMGRLSPDRQRDLIAAKLRELGAPQPERAIADLDASPLVEVGDDVLRVVDPAQPWLVGDFFQRDPVAARNAHDLLAQLEEYKRTAEELEDPGDSDASAVPAAERLLGDHGVSESVWFAIGRHAYYLAAIKPSDSLQEFVEAFARPPHFDPDGARQWLTSLVLRQEAHLDSKLRELSFFRAFHTFTQGVPSAALNKLRRVCEAGPEDAYTALSLYLAGVIEGTSRNPQTVAHAVTTLTSSIRLSDQLELLENEVRARLSVGPAPAVRVGRSLEVAIATENLGALADRPQRSGSRIGQDHGSRDGSSRRSESSSPSPQPMPCSSSISSRVIRSPTSLRSAKFTVSRLVLSRYLIIAVASSSSSMSMFVRLTRTSVDLNM